MLPALAALVLLAPFALAAGVDAPDGGEARIRQCEEIAPLDNDCSISLVSAGGIELKILHKRAFSGTLNVVAEQLGQPIWNATCIVPLGVLNTGVGTCFGENETVPLFTPNVTLNLTISVGTYGAGDFGLYARY